jgi:hypothetical protein
LPLGQQEHEQQRQRAQHADAICSAFTIPTPLTMVPIPAGIGTVVWLVAARNGHRKLFQRRWSR